MESKNTPKIMLKGSCHWFAQRNYENIQQMCRYGSMCPFLHFTGKECEDYYYHGKELVPCPSCSSDTPEKEENSLENSLEKAEKYARMMTGCFMLKCHDGKVQKGKIMIDKVHERDWCKCPKETVETFELSPGKHPKFRRDYVIICKRCQCIVNALSS